MIHVEAFGGSTEVMGSRARRGAARDLTVMPSVGTGLRGFV
jgi:hypothetical protein